MTAQYIAVMCKHENADEFSLDTGFNIDILGIEEAMRWAQEYMAEQQKLWKDSVEYRLEGKEM